ncbi:hypothetical protein O181_066105 [Austropuccinia psidii MF-1]|uniref:Uncharacterized protein n=1 Tax=Austropuccinia psidii MF-1 TaxID=1389203 RepID=A0A9Q3I4S3_9BASI|nr:hypothetical protein [Austropuccinia psidii MF-1]
MSPVPQEPGMGIHGIIYHYGSFFLSNPMVTLSRLHSKFSSLVTSTSVHFEGKTYLAQVGNAWQNPEGHLRTPTPWLPRCWYFTPGLLKGLFQEVVEHQALLGKFNSSIKDVFRSLYGIDPFGPVHIPLWEFKAHCSNFKMARYVLNFPVNKAG